MDLSQFDVKFRLFGIPVRIMPSFWLLALLLSPFLHPTQGNAPWIFGALGWIVAVGLSFLAHEFGHAFAARRFFGANPSIELGVGRSQSGSGVFGGLTEWRPAYGMTLDPQKRALTSAAGPCAALLCAFALVAIAFLVFRATIRVQFEFGFLPIPLPLEWIAIANSKSAFGLFFGYFIFGFIWSSVFWSFFNLLPIYPMDGGQILYNVLVGRNGSSGRRTTYLVSIVCSTAIAVYFLMDQMFFNSFVFGYFAVFNYRIMKASGF